MSDWITHLLDAAHHLRAGRPGLAAALLHQVLASQPDQPNALFMLGSAMLADNPASAIAPLTRVLALQPGHRSARLATARALLATGQAAAALEILEPLASDRALAAATLLRGTALSALGRAEEAVQALTDTVASDPAHAEAHLNLGNALAACGQPGLAEHHIRHALALDPAMPEAHASLGHLLAGAGHLPQAVAACGAAIALRPDFAPAHWNLAVTHLLGGDLAAGWPEFEWRKQRFASAFANSPASPAWRGGDLAGQSLLVLTEQGHGDTIQFSRYLPLLVARGASVLLECAAALAPLLAQLAGVAIIPRGAARPPFDLWVDLLSLPGLFGTTLDSIPSPAGYLRPDAAQAAAWDQALPHRLRIGLACFGNPAHSNDRQRSLPIGALDPIVTAAGHSMVSLQTGPQSAALAERLGVPDRSAALTHWSATAALVASLDLVITVDTAVAHLAGALGIPVWLLLPHAPDWRWMLGRSDSPWYASMQIFRQSAPGDWAGVAHRVAVALTGITR